MGAPVGNQNAKKAKRWQDALLKALARYENKDAQIAAGQALDKIAEMVVMQALGGSKDAWLEIGNRLDGKPAQAIVGDDDADPISVREILIRGVTASDRPPSEGG